MKEGADFKQPDLAAVLTRIAEDGAADFYDGQTADLIAASMRGHGLITKRDLQEYTAVWRQPIEGDWNGLHVITAPPPSSGGVGLLQLLKMRADLQADFKDAPLNSPQPSARILSVSTSGPRPCRFRRSFERIFHRLPRSVNS